LPKRTRRSGRSNSTGKSGSWRPRQYHRRHCSIQSGFQRAGSGSVENQCSRFPEQGPAECHRINAAFAQLPYPFDNAQDISSISDPATINTLRQILQYHVALGQYTAADLVNGGYKTYKSAVTPNDNLLYVGRDASGNVFINGNSKVIAANIVASNGIIHVINKVLFFPTKDIAQIAAGNGGFTALVAALQKTGLIGAVTQPGNNLTVFAPTDAAFAQLPAPLNTAANIRSISDPGTIDQLRKVLTYHVIGARVFSADLRDGIQPATLFAGEQVSISLANGPKVKGNGNATGSNIVLTDLLARNGVIHVIDQVLLP
jgi:uncharacterized surface protein with fasciclin (FAS1) repeats